MPFTCYFRCHANIAIAAPPLMLAFMITLPLPLFSLRR